MIKQIDAQTFDIDGWKELQNCSIYHCDTEDEWKKARKNYITASESACVLGIGFHDNVWLWEEKIGVKHADDFSSQTLNLLHKGKVNEPLSREQWANETGHTVFDGTLNLVVSDKHKDKLDHSFMAATLDAIGIDENGKPYVIELKYSESPKTFRDGMPPKYRCQVLKQMIVTGLDRAVLIARIVWLDLDGHRHVTEKEFWLDANDPDVAYDMEQLVKAETHFWNDFVLEKKRPPLLLPSL